MKLTEKQQKQLNEHLAKSWKPPVACQVCKSNNWNISDHVYELREFHVGALVLGGSSGGIVPLCPVICNSCGNTVLINPLVAGLELEGAESDSK